MPGLVTLSRLRYPCPAETPLAMLCPVMPLFLVRYKPVTAAVSINLFPAPQVLCPTDAAKAMRRTVSEAVDIVTPAHGDGTGFSYLRGEPLCSLSLVEPPEFLLLNICSTIAFGPTNSISYFRGVRGTEM